MLFGLIFPYILFGQFSDFDLSKYKLPDIKTNRLDLNFSLNENGYKNFSQHSRLDTTETKHNYLKGSMNLSYYNFRNSEKYQGDFLINASFIPEISKTGRNELISKNGNINTALIIRSKNIFFNQNMNFLEVNPSLSYSSINDRDHQDISSNSFRDKNVAEIATTISIPVSVGHGRIEPIEDARLAIYIIEELSKAGKISDKPTDNVIIEMAKQISKIKRKRFLDSRIMKIKELQVIDSFLVANKIISSYDINYFSILNDQWDYASGPQRQSGFAISAGFNDNLSFGKYYFETFHDTNVPSRSNSKTNNYKLGGFINLRYAKPINLYWQTSATFETSYNIEFTSDPEEKDSEISSYSTNVFRTYLSYSLQFIPNSRTSIGFNVQGEYSNLKGDRTFLNIDPVDFDIKSNQLALSPGIELCYYISPQLRIQVNSSFYLQNFKSMEEFESPFLDNEYNFNRNEHYLSVNLIYSFF
jgi:hypothetical protein